MKTISFSLKMKSGFSWYAIFSLLFLASISAPFSSQAFRIAGPNGPGVRLFRNAPCEVSWTGGNPNGLVSISFSANNGRTYPYTLATGVPVSVGRRVVVMPGISTFEGKIRIITNLSSINDTQKVDVTTNPIIVESTGAGSNCIACAPTGTNAKTHRIESIFITRPGTPTFTPIIDASISSVGYIDFFRASPTLQLVAGQTYKVELKLTGSGWKTIGVWLDGDADCNLGSTISELVATGTTNLSDITRSFTVPSSWLWGDKRLRIRVFGSTASTTPLLTRGQSCSNILVLSIFASTSSGQTQDFKATLGSGSRIALEQVETEPQAIHKEISVFPNPVLEGESTNIRISGFEENGYDACVFELSGKKVFSYSMTPLAGNTDKQIKLSKGVYIIRVSDADNIIYKKLIVQ